MSLDLYTFGDRCVLFIVAYRRLEVDIDDRAVTIIIPEAVDYASRKVYDVWC